MGTGSFRQPPPGPKIGPVKTPDELPESRREELGDLEKLAADPSPAAVEDLEPAPDPADSSEEGAERLAALESVLAREQAPDIDPTEAALAEAAEPTVDDRREFLRCMLGNVPYIKEYRLFGDLLVIRLQDLAPREEDRLFAQMALAQRKKRIETQDDWDLLLDRYRIIFNVKDLLWAGRERDVIPAEAAAAEDVYPLLEQVLNGFASATVYRAVLRTVRVFQRHLNRLVEGAVDPDFWAVGGPDLPSEPIFEGPSTTPAGRD